LEHKIPILKPNIGPGGVKVDFIDEDANDSKKDRNTSGQNRPQQS